MPSETNLMSTAGLYGTHHCQPTDQTKCDTSVPTKERKEGYQIVFGFCQRKRETERVTLGRSKPQRIQPNPAFFFPSLGSDPSKNRSDFSLLPFPTLQWLVGTGYTPCTVFPDISKPLHSCENWTMPRSRHIQRPIYKVSLIPLRARERKIVGGLLPCDLSTTNESCLRRHSTQPTVQS